MEPAIIPRVSCHFIGLRYDHKQRLWSRDEFNTNSDPNALDVLLNAPGLEFHLMAATASQSLVFEKAEVDRRLKGKGGVADFLVRLWDNYDRAWQRRVAGIPRRMKTAHSRGNRRPCLQAAAIVSLEQHSPIMGIAAGVTSFASKPGGPNVKGSRASMTCLAR